MSSTTSLLLFDTESDATFVAEVLAADATATTFLLNCPTGTDGNDCGTYNESVIVGPWAQPTPPPDASTGVYDVEINMGTEWFFHLHCDMIETAPSVCTTTNIGGNDDGSPTATFTALASDNDLGAFAYVPITITSGLEKLASATASAGSGSESGSGVTAGATSTHSTTTLSGTTGTTGTQSATSATGTSAAILGRGEPLVGSLAIIGLAIGWLLR